MEIIERNKVLYISGRSNGQRIRLTTGLKLDGVNDVRIRGLAQVKLGEYIASLGAAQAGEGKVHDWIRRNKRKQLIKYLELIPAHYTWSNLNREFVIGLVVAWEDRELKPGTIHTYLDELLAMHRKAARAGLCTKGPNWERADVIDYGRGTAVRRVTLGDDEVEKFWEVVDTTNYDIKAAFIFSIYTGLRWSDLKSLKWNDLDSGVADKMQIKTTDQVRIKTASMALKALSGLTKAPEYVFSLPTHPHSLELLQSLGKASGITKHLTWHVARHTFAVRLLNAGVEIFDTSKLLGHRSVKSTMHYAQISGTRLNQGIDLIDY